MDIMVVILFVSFTQSVALSTISHHKILIPFQRLHMSYILKFPQRCSLVIGYGPCLEMNKFRLRAIKNLTTLVTDVFAYEEVTLLCCCAIMSPLAFNYYLQPFQPSRTFLTDGRAKRRLCQATKSGYFFSTSCFSQTSLKRLGPIVFQGTKAKSAYVLRNM